MPEAFAYDLHRHARLHQDRRVSVTSVVQANARQRRLRDMTIEDLAEQVGVRWPAFECAEHDVDVVWAMA